MPYEFEQLVICCPEQQCLVVWSLIKPNQDYLENKKTIGQSRGTLDLSDTPSPSPSTTYPHVSMAVVSMLFSEESLKDQSLFQVVPRHFGQERSFKQEWG